MSGNNFIKIDINNHPWIKNIPVKSRVSEIDSILEIGYNISKLGSLSINPNNDYSNNINGILQGITQQEKFIDNKMSLYETKIDILNEVVSNSIGTLNNQVESYHGGISQLLKITNNASVKGRAMENIIGDIIKNNFPDYCLHDTHKETGKSDFHLQLEEGVKILIEVKCYNSVVSTEQVHKFYRDIENNNLQGGILISSGSGICGKKRMDFEKIKDSKLVVFIPNLDSDYSKLTWAIIFLGELIKVYQKKNTREINPKILLDHLEPFRNDIEKLMNISFDIHKSKEGIINILNNIYKNSVDLELRLKANLKNINNYLVSEIDSITNSSNLSITLDDFLLHVNETNPKLNSLLNSLVAFLKKIDNINFIINDKIEIEKNGILVGEVVIKKTKVELKLKDSILIDVKGLPSFDIIKNILNSF